METRELMMRIAAFAKEAETIMGAIDKKKEHSEYMMKKAHDISIDFDHIIELLPTQAHESARLVSYYRDIRLQRRDAKDFLNFTDETLSMFETLQDNISVLSDIVNKHLNSYESRSYSFRSKDMMDYTKTITNVEERMKNYRDQLYMGFGYAHNRELNSNRLLSMDDVVVNTALPTSSQRDDDSFILDEETAATDIDVDHLMLDSYRIVTKSASWPYGEGAFLVRRDQKNSVWQGLFYEDGKLYQVHDSDMNQFFRCSLLYKAKKILFTTRQNRSHFVNFVNMSGDSNKGRLFQPLYVKCLPALRHDICQEEDFQPYFN